MSRKQARDVPPEQTRGSSQVEDGDGGWAGHAPCPRRLRERSAMDKPVLCALGARGSHALPVFAAHARPRSCGRPGLLGVHAAGGGVGPTSALGCNFRAWSLKALSGAHRAKVLVF